MFDTRGVARFFEESEFDRSVLMGETVAVLGYGNQGRAHALNLRDSGFRVLVGARPGGGGALQAVNDGFAVLEIKDAAARADTMMVSLPDEVMAEVFVREVLPGVEAGNAVLFAHGFNVVYGFIGLVEGVDFGMVAPKGAGVKVRNEYLEGRGLACLAAVEQDASGKAWDRVLGWCWGLGGFRTLVMETNFREETHCDLFGEQTVLCGGIPELLKAGFETLVAAGYSPEAAYFECIHEAKLITDLIYARGIAGMRSAISNTAEWGGFEVGQSVIGEEARGAMKTALDRVQDGSFAAGWMAEARSGMRTMKALETEEEEHGSEAVGDDLRRKMGIAGRE